MNILILKDNKWYLTRQFTGITGMYNLNVAAQAINAQYTILNGAKGKGLAPFAKKVLMDG